MSIEHSPDWLEVSLYIVGVGAMWLLINGLLTIRRPGLFTNIMLGCGAVGQFVFLIAGTVVFTWGWCMFARAKGHPTALGLIGLVPILGWVALLALPDRKSGARANGFPVIFEKSDV